MSTVIDVARACRETPGCERVLHFNNAGAALMPEPVIAAVTAHLEREAQIGGYEAADEANDAVERVYDSAARLLDCARDEIAVIENATRAWDMAFYAISFRPGDRILTARAEYASNYIAYLQIARKTGAVVEVVPDDEAGQLSVEALRQMADERVRLIAVTHVPTNGGLVNPAAEIGVVAREVGALYLLDACQSVGQMPIDVDEIGCDLLSVTGRKFLRGPRGTGLLYVRRAILDQLEPPLLDLHAAEWVAPDRYVMRDDARRFENWESNVAAKLGLGAAINYALDWGLEAIWARVSSLADTLRKRLGELPGVAVRDQGVVRCGIVSFTVEGADLMALQDALRAQKINVSVSPSAYTLIDMEARGLSSVVRASVHYYNTEEEITRFCAALAKLRR
jgi:selenocysteine lyase/cysteine desulfurase